MGLLMNDCSENTRFVNVEPFVKWAGGKRQLLPVLTKLLPKEPIHTYCEPFVGGGALLFHLQPEVAYINDINGELINAYQVIRNAPDALISMLRRYENTLEFYYQIRNLDRDAAAFAALSEVERAARFIYLNKTCFNGLYRVNQKGQFNVSFGNYPNPNIVNADVIYGVGIYLNHAQIHFTQTDFQELLQAIPNDTFVYLDPPYLPDIEKPSFTQYSKNGFSLYDHLRLHWSCAEMTKRGIRFMLSNSCTPVVTSLYANYVITPVQARRSINCNGAERGAVTEVVVRNYI